MDITKRQIKEALRLTTDVEVAAFFGTSKQAVGAWGDDDALPEGRQWQAIALRPDIFDAPVKPAKQVA
jgi:DNA-binding transcriptional regulator YiaG